MLDIPIGKAVMAVEIDSDRNGCVDGCLAHHSGHCNTFSCYPFEREDGKNVIFKLVDLESIFKKIKEDLDNGRISNAKAALDNLLQGVENER